MKILHVSPMYSPARGGAELHLKELSERLVSRGHVVTVLTANVKSVWELERGARGNLAAVEVINGVNVVRVPPDVGRLGTFIGSWQRMRGGYRTARLLFGKDDFEMWVERPLLAHFILHTLRADAHIVTAMNWYWPSAYHAYVAGRLKRFPFVGIPLFHTASAWSAHPVYRRMLQRCDAVIVNTTHEGQFARERGARRVQVAGVGVEPKAFDGRDGESMRRRLGLARWPVVGFVGRQLPSKGVVRLIEAMNRVWQWNGDVRLVLAGQRRQGDGQEPWLDQVPERYRERVIRIDDFAEEDKGSLYEAFDIFAMPSLEESFGIAYLEAWLCKKAVIGARTGVTECVITHGVDGLLVDPEDPEALATAIIELLSNPDKRERMGSRGHATTITKYAWDKVTDRVEAVYRELVGPGRR